MLCGTALSGLGLALFISVPARALAALALSCAIAAWLLRARPTWRLLMLLLCAAALGGLRGSSYVLNTARENAADPLTAYLGVPISLSVTVVDGPVASERAVRASVAVEAIAPRGQPPLPL